MAKYLFLNVQHLPLKDNSTFLSYFPGRLYIFFKMTVIDMAECCCVSKPCNPDPLLALSAVGPHCF